MVIKFLYIYIYRKNEHLIKFLYIYIYIYRKNEHLITTFQQPKLENQTQMSITTSPQNRNVHKIPTQITVTKITQMTVPCPQSLNLKKLSMLSGSLMLRV